mgnify:CR=1 FL=1
MSTLENIPNDIAVFVVTHKSFNLPQEAVLVPIQVGNGIGLGYISDNQLDNIADKNPFFSELTALYFIWKNIKTPIIGLVHYRRYFVFKQNIVFWRLNQIAYHLNLNAKQQTKRLQILNRHTILQALKNADMIIPSPLVLGMTVYEHYDKCHHIKDWNIIQKILATKFPEYLLTMNQVEQGNILYPYNMFIGRKNIMDKYCEWLFDILFEAEKFIDYSQYNSYNQRVFGFLSERLFTVWFFHHQEQYRFKHFFVELMKE